MDCTAPNEADVHQANGEHVGGRRGQSVQKAGFSVRNAQRVGSATVINMV